jgi:BlaI family transcriptional regulator, penicillinase repressor
VSKSPSPSREPGAGKEPTPRELEILKLLWQLGPSSVRDVHRALQADEPDLAYNTVQTLLRIMEGRDLVAHEEQGRAFIYTALFTRDETAGRFLDRVFDGAASQLVNSLLAGERISAEEMDRIQALLARARRQKREGER